MPDCSCKCCQGGSCKCGPDCCKEDDCTCSKGNCASGNCSCICESSCACKK